MPVHNGFIRDAAGNASPAGLRQLGAFFPIEIHVPPPIAELLTQQGQPVPSGVSGLALVDTGATLTCVHEPILTGLGLNPISVVQSGTANGLVPQNVYPARLVFPSTGWTVDAQQAVGVNLGGQTMQLDATQPPQAVIALLGRNLLEHWVLVWNGPVGFWSVSF